VEKRRKSNPRAGEVPSPSKIPSHPSSGISENLDEGHIDNSKSDYESEESHPIAVRKVGRKTNRN
jgi:hypothetical protein